MASPLRRSSSLRRHALTVAAALILGFASPAAWGAGPTLVAGAGSSASGVFTAGADGARWRIAGGGTISARAHTKLRFLPPTKLALSRPNQQTYVLTLESGHGDVELPPATRATPAVLVRAPRQLGLALETGDASLSAGAHDSAIAVVRGKALINRGGPQWRAASEGTVYLGSGGVRSVVAAPVLATRAELRFAIAGAGAAAPEISWTSVAGAASYETTLSGATLRESSVGSGAVWRREAPLAPGDYELRVRAVDELGLYGAASEPCQLRVVPVALPEGGYVDAHGAAYLPDGQSLSVPVTPGMELSYGDSRSFGRAPKRLGLLRGEPTLVFARLMGQQEPTRLLLMPRRVSARVSVGPKRAVWPRDTIELRIELATPDGAPPAGVVEVKPRVSLGLAELDLGWERRGSVLYAKLPPRTGTGPWVLRVEAVDQYGNELGRDFVEIVSAPKRGKSTRSTTRVAMR